MGSKLRMNSFSLCAGSKGLVIKERKAANEVHRTALLLNFAGEDVQENLNTFTNAGTAVECPFHTKSKWVSKHGTI